MIELMAHAKLTWFLEITGVRENGYHELRSEMTTISLHDVLILDETGDHLQILNPFTSEVASDETNLVTRALQLVQRRAGRRWARWRQRRRRGHTALGGRREPRGRAHARW